MGIRVYKLFSVVLNPLLRQLLLSVAINYSSSSLTWYSRVRACATQVYQPVKDLVCYVVLAVLPWCGSTLEGQWSSGLDELIEVLGFHMDNRLPIVKGGLRGTFVRSISKENEPDGEEEEEEDDTTTESLQVLWALVRAMHKQGWKESTIPKSIPQPWRSCAEELSNVIPIPLPGDLGYASIHHNAIHLGIISASSYDGGNGWVEPRNTSRYAASNSLCHAYTLYIHGELELFDEDSGQEAGTIGSLHPKEKLMLCDFARDVLACMQPFIQTDGTRIGSFSSVVQQLLSVGKLAPQKCYIEYLIVELMLQALLIVPQPPCWSAYIQRVLLELCCAAPDIAPRALAFTTGTLFHEITAMDTSVTLLFGNWFAYHLKDISTNWPLWKHWSHVIEADPLDPQRIFLSVALQKFAKLCQPDRVRDAVPEELWPLAHLHFDAAVVGADQTTPIHVSSDSQGRENDETDAATPDSDPILDAMLLPLTAAAEGRSEITADGGKGEEETSDIPGSEKVGGKLKNSLKGLVSILKDENNTYEDVRAWLHYQASLWGEQKEQYGRTVPERTDSEHSFELYYGGREIEVVLRAILRAAGPNPLNIRELLNQYNEVLGIHIVGGQNNNERNLGSGKPPPNPTAVGNNETQQAVQMRLLEVVRRAWPTREEGVRHSVLSSQMFHSTVDSLLAEKVISPLAVVNYAFESSLDNCVYDVLGGGWDLLDSALRHAKRAAALDSSGKVVKGIEDDEMDCLDVQMEEEFANDKNPRLVNDSDASVFKTSTSSEADEIQLCSELILRCTDVLPLLSGEKRHIASCLLRRILRRCLSRRVLAKGCVDSMRAAKEHGRELDSLERDVLNFAIEEATKPKAAA